MGWLIHSFSPSTPISSKHIPRWEQVARAQWIEASEEQPATTYHRVMWALEGNPSCPSPVSCAGGRAQEQNKKAGGQSTSIRPHLEVSTESVLCVSPVSVQSTGVGASPEEW